MIYFTEIVDHHIDDFYEEYPREEKRDNTPNTRHYSHKSIHDWLPIDHRPETTEHRPKTTEYWSEPTKKALRNVFSYNKHSHKIYDKQKKGQRGQHDTDNNSKLIKKTKSKKATTESFNKYHPKLYERDRYHFHKLFNSEYDLDNRKYTKTTEIKTKNTRAKTPPDSSKNYYAKKQRYEDDGYNFLENIETTERYTSEYPNEYFVNNIKYDDDDYNFHKNIKTTAKPTSQTTNKYYAKNKRNKDEDLYVHIKTKTHKSTFESPNKYNANNKKIRDVDNFSYHKNAKATDEPTLEFSKIYYKNGENDEDDDLNFHKNIKTIHKTTSQSQKQHYINNQNGEDDDFTFYSNTKTNIESTSESPNKYQANNEQIDDNNFNFHRNTKPTRTFVSPNKYRTNNKENKDFNFHQNARNIDKFVSPDKYVANNKKYKDDDFDSHRNTKTSHTTTFDFADKFHKNKKIKDDDFSFHKNTMTTHEIISETINKYRASKQNYGNDDSNFHRNTKPIRTFVSPNKYRTSNKENKDDDFNFHQNIKTTHKFVYPNKFDTNNKKNEDDNFDYQRNTRTTPTTTFDSANKYHAKNKQIEYDDFGFHKNTKAAHDTISESSNKYPTTEQNYKKYEYNYHENTKTTHKPTPEHHTNNVRMGIFKFTTGITTSEFPNKYHVLKQKYVERNDFDFHKTTNKTTTGFTNNYNTNEHNYNDKIYQKSSNSEDKFDNAKFTTNTEIRSVPMNEDYTKKYERAEKHSDKLYNFEKNAGRRDTHSAEASTPIESTNDYRSMEHENINTHKLLNVNNKLTTIQTSDNAEINITTPIKEMYSKLDAINRNYTQESSNSDNNVTNSPKIINTSEIKTTAAIQSAQWKKFIFRALPLNKRNSTVQKRNDMVLQSSTTEDRLRVQLSQATDIGSTITSTENYELSNELSKNDMESHTEGKFATEWTWPTFEDMLEEIGKKYDWRKDRWIELKSHVNNKMTKSDFIKKIQEKHKFSYSTIKLNSTKSRRNVVIAVTAVR